MKTIYFIIFLMTALMSNSQTFFGGFKGGVTGSQISGDFLSGFNKGGISAGVFAGLETSHNTSIVSEMIFVQKGSRKNPQPDKNDPTKYLLRLNYIEMPLLFLYQGNEYFQLEAGFSFGTLIKNTDVEQNENGILPDAEPFNQFELSGNLGFNYIVNERTKINFRANNSLLPIREHKGGGKYWFNRGQYSTVLMLGIIYSAGRTE